MKNDKHNANNADAACRPCAERVNASARQAGYAALEKRREGLFVPFAAFASLAGATGLPLISL